MGTYVDALDDSAWPVIYARFTGRVDLDDFDRFAAWHEAAVHRAIAARKRLVSISDCRLVAGGADSSVRKHIADWMSSLTQPQCDAMILGIIVIDRTLERGILRAIHWLSPPRSPTVIVADLDEAWRKTMTAVTEAGLARPAKPKTWPTATTTLSPATPSL